MKYNPIWLFRLSESLRPRRKINLDFVVDCPTAAENFAKTLEYFRQTFHKLFDLFHRGNWEVEHERKNSCAKSFHSDFFRQKFVAAVEKVFSEKVFVGDKYFHSQTLAADELLRTELCRISSARNIFHHKLFSPLELFSENLRNFPLATILKITICFRSATIKRDQVGSYLGLRKGKSLKLFISADDENFSRQSLQTSPKFQSFQILPGELERFPPQTFPNLFGRRSFSSSTKIYTSVPRLNLVKLFLTQFSPTFSDKKVSSLWSCQLQSKISRKLLLLQTISNKLFVPYERVNKLSLAQTLFSQSVDELLF